MIYLYEYDWDWSEEHFGAGPITGEESGQIRPDQLLPDEGRGLLRSQPQRKRWNGIITYLAGHIQTQMEGRCYSHEVAGMLEGVVLMKMLGHWKVSWTLSMEDSE